MDKIHDFEKENIISFSNRKDLIQFVSKYLALQYKDFLKMECAMAMDDLEEQKYWDNKIISDVSRLEAILRVLLFFKLIFNKRLEITSKSTVFKNAFGWLGEELSPEVCFPENVKYKINNLVFEKEIGPYR